MTKVTLKDKGLKESKVVYMKTYFIYIFFIVKLLDVSLSCDINNNVVLPPSFFRKCSGLSSGAQKCLWWS